MPTGVLFFWFFILFEGLLEIVNKKKERSGKKKMKKIRSNMKK
jgi:hypothetical protein